MSGTSIWGGSDSLNAAHAMTDLTSVSTTQLGDIYFENSKPGNNILPGPIQGSCMFQYEI